MCLFVSLHSGLFVAFPCPSGNAGGIFNIDTALGVISLTRTLAEAQPPEYLLLVRATDHAAQARAASVPVRVMVTASQSSPPSWQGNKPHVEEVGEWVAVGTALARVTASSPSALHYSLTGGNEHSAFVISPASGVVSVATPLDYETTSWYNLTITATNLVSPCPAWYARKTLNKCSLQGGYSFQGEKSQVLSDLDPDRVVWPREMCIGLDVKPLPKKGNS